MPARCLAVVLASTVLIGCSAGSEGPGSPEPEPSVPASSGSPSASAPAAPPAAAGATREGCPQGMVLIPAGTYTLGRTLEVPEWDPRQTVRPSGPFWVLPNPAQEVGIKAFCIDRFEYPNRKGERPTSMVSWIEAGDLCRALGKRLPSRLEWMAAAQGKDGWKYSYGDEMEPGRCNTGRDPRTEGDTTPASSGSFLRCHSPLGVYDLNGNLSEWVEDPWEGPWFDDRAWGGKELQPHTLMGGTMWEGYVYGQSSLSRHRHPMHGRWEDDGFRCAITL